MGGWSDHPPYAELHGKLMPDFGQIDLWDKLPIGGTSTPHR